MRQAAHLHGLAVDAENGRKVLLAAHEGLVVGHPADAWRRADAWSGHADAYAAYPSAWGVAWATVHEGGSGTLLHSVDGGATWSAVAARDVHALAASGAADGLLWGLIDGRLARSTDSGRAWSSVEAERAPQGIRALEADVAIPTGLYAAGAEGLAHTSDGGRTWRLLRAGNAWAVEVDVNSGLLYASFSDGVYASPDGGDTWRLTGFKSPRYPVAHVAVNPQDPRMVYAATSDGRLFRSVDSAGSWSLVFG